MISQWQFFGGPGSFVYRMLDVLRRRLNQGLVGYLSSCTLPQRGAVVVEAGSGPASGSSAFRAIASVRLSVAIDLDPDALREARRRDSRLTLIVADIHRLPLRGGCSDLVWSSSTLEHLAMREVALGEMARVARPNGHVFVGVPYRYGPLGFQPLISATRIGEWIGPVFGRRELHLMAGRVGLQPTAISTYFFGFFVGVLARKAADTPLTPVGH